MPRLRENILLNFEFKNEATGANLQENRRILKWRPFWNKVYLSLFLARCHLLLFLLKIVHVIVSGSLYVLNTVRAESKLPL